MQHFDIVIVGGGLVGASLAHALAGSGFKIAIIENQDLSALYNPALDNRGLALSYTSKKILQKLQIWPQIQAHAHLISAVHVSEQNSFGITMLRAKDINLPGLGYVVSAAHLATGLIKSLHDLSDLQVFAPQQIKTIELVATEWHIELDATKIQAKLLIAADGTKSQLRNMLNIHSAQKEFQQSALVTNVFIKDEHHNTAYERFTAQGVLALLPFGAQRMKCILTVPNHQLAELTQLNDQQFMQLLHSLFGYRLGGFTGIEPRSTFPIQHVQAKRLYSTAAVIIGNTANTMHPVAAQGFNLGLRDAVLLAQILVKARGNSQPINSATVLEEYAQMRQLDHKNTQSFTNSLVEIFAHNTGFIKHARRFGLTAIQFMPSLRRKILQYGIGTCKL